MIFNKFKIYILLFLSLILLYLSNNLLRIDDRLREDLLNNLSLVQVNQVFEFKSKWGSVSYLIIILIILIKIFFTSFTLFIGLFFFEKKQVVFKKVWEISVNAEFIFLLVPLLKIIWFCFFQTNFKIEDIQYFYPLSALNIVGYKGLDPWLIYPLQTLNLFEVAYWLLLSYYIGKIASPTKNIEENKYPMDFGLKIVASSYGSALLLWVVVVMFFTLNYS
jgi:hypothetical protein